MKKFFEKNILGYIMVLPALLVMLLVVIYPIINTIFRSFQNAHGKFTFENYKYFFTSMAAFESLIFTLITSFLVVGIGLAISYMLAIYMRFSNSKVSKVVSSLYLIPRFIPGIVAVNAVMNIIKDSGFINRFLLVFGIDFKPGLLYDMKGIVVANLWFTIPFATMLLSAALSNIEDSYIESAKDCGSNKLKIFSNIILPLTIKDVVVAGTFIFMGQIGSFSIPYLTGPNNPKMLGVLLYQQVSTYMDYEKAATLSVLMFIICIGATIIYMKTNLKQSQWENC